MAKNMFQRKKKDNKPVLAICYDFDKTLSPDDMQAQGYIQTVGFDDVEEFWKQSNEMAEINDMDQNSAWMYKMITESIGKTKFSRDNLQKLGSKVKLFPGVDGWFERINAYAEDIGVIVEHYIISSGLKEMIEGTSIYKNNVFEKVFASSFYFDEKGDAKWPAQIVNYTNKTQFLFRISKGILDINDQGVNDHFSTEEIRIPFRNMVYIGDSATDIPCMKLVNSYGGYSVGVYNSETLDKTKVYNMFNDSRIKYFAPADYSKDSELDKLIKAIVDRTYVNEKLENIYYTKKQEVENSYKQGDAKTYGQDALIEKLGDSTSFKNTHQVISELEVYNEWTKNQVEKLCNIAINNSQVLWILLDKDVKEFFTTLVEYGYDGEYISKVRSKINYQLQ